MNADQAQSVVARCLTDPDFLLRAQSRSRSDAPGKGTAEDIAAEMLGDEELERLRRFRGFITKVKHNALRRRIPATLGLMGALGIEHAFFCEFSPTYVAARQNGPIETTRHLDLIADALSDFLVEQSGQIATPVAETFAHERRLCEMGLQAPAVTETEHMLWHGVMTLMPKTVEVVRICERIGARNFAMSDLVWRNHVLCYWRPKHQDAVSIFEVDAVTGAILSAIRDGEGPAAVQELLADSGLSQISLEELRAAAIAAARRGFVELRGGWLR